MPHTDISSNLSDFPSAIALEDEGRDVVYGDAVCITPYDETQYGKEIIVTFGGKRDSKQWKPLPMPAGAFIAMLCKHKEGKKDGTSYVLGDMVAGQRLKTSVKALHGVGLDIDTGTPTEVVDTALQRLGCLAVRCSTHSSGKIETEIKKDKVVKFAGDREIDGDLMREFLISVEKWDASIVETVEYLGTEHTKKGIVCKIGHAPMRKHRIVLLFKEPFVIGNEGKTQAEAMRKWAKVPEALANLLGVPFDTSCTDPSRLFYLPRHAKGKPFGISLFGGPYFDWRTLELNDPMEKLAVALNKGHAKSVTDAGRELGRWSLKHAHGFQIADVIDANAPERIRHKAGHGYEIECPFDEDHSNAGEQDDRACLVVNAGEGPSEFFTVSCRHETCRNKTNLDMLGKMIEDGWFQKAVIDEDQFNAILEDDQKPEVAVQIEKQDKAKLGYSEAIESLHPESSEAEIEAVAALIVAAKLPPIPKDRAIRAMAKRIGEKPTVVKDTLKLAERSVKDKKGKKTATVNNDGRVPFEYKVEFHFDDACDVCSNALLAKNKRDALPTFSQMDGSAVRLNIRDGRAEFIEMDQTVLWSELNKLVTFVRLNNGDGEDTRQSVDRNVAAHIYAQAYASMPPAPEVLYTPIYLADGSLLLTEGYHARPDKHLNVLLMLNGLMIPDVPENPSPAQMKASLNWIRNELLSDFPFCDTNLKGEESPEPSEANALAMLITPFMRRMIEGPTPVFAITKPSPGTGATLLASLPMMLFDGLEGEGASIHYTPKEDEMEKKLVAAIMETRSHLFFDDVKDFNNRVLLRALTSERIGGRLLGSSKNVFVPNRFNWIITGINPKIGGEMHRRTCWIRLNAKTPNTAERTYRHPDTSGLNFPAFVRQNRGLAIHHLLTLVEYWQSMGLQEFTERRLASFEDWSAKVGGVLMACGIEGFLDTRAPVILDPEKAAEDEFLSDAFRLRGVGAAMSATDLYNWADGAGLGIITGRSPEEKRSKFNETLRTLEGRTFKAGDDLIALRAEYGEDGSIKFDFRMVEAPK